MLVLLVHASTCGCGLWSEQSEPQRYKMSRSEFRDGKYHFLNYKIEQYNRGKGPPLISKKSRLIVAATNNDLPTLKELLDSPKWYEVRDQLGLNLLQIAILRENVEVFDYLLSLDDFPLEAVNEEGDTALVVALTYYVRDDPEAVSCDGIKALKVACATDRRGRYTHFRDIHNRYSYELIKKGANIYKKTLHGDSLLYCALEKCWNPDFDFLSVAKLLLDKGADINSDGKIPHVFDNEEAITMLLCYGADLSLINQDRLQDIVNQLLLHDYKNRQGLQENLLYFIYDEWNLCKLDAHTLFTLAETESPLFYQVINLTSEIITITERKIDFRTIDCFLLFSIDLQYLRVFIEKYPYVVKSVLQSYTKDSLNLKFVGSFCLKNLEMLLKSSLCLDTMELIPKLHSSRFIERLTESYTKRTKDKYIKIIYCLLSYGMSLNEQDLERIYSITGYSMDFKNLLFMDLQKSVNKEVTNIMPRLLYDFTLDLHNSVKDTYSCWRSINWNQLFDYFAHPKFQDIYFEYHLCTKGCRCGIEKRLPKIPLLQELARDAFRKHFIKVFEIKSAKEFYGLIKLLPIRSGYKKIITFETKLYKLKK